MKTPEHAGSAKEPQRTSSRKVLFAVVVALLAAMLLWLLPRGAAPQPQASTAKKASAAGAYGIKGGRLTPLDSAAEIPSKSSLTNIQYVFDSNRASGVRRFLVGTHYDENYREDSDSPSGREMWVTDEQGNERLVHKSVFRARFSPDGTKIAFTSSDCMLHVETLDGEKLSQVEKAFDPSWRADGKEILFVKVPAEVELWPAEVMNLATLDYSTGEVKLLTKDNYDDILPTYSPSAKWVLFVSGGRSGWASFYLMPAGGGQPVELTNREMGIPVPYDRMFWSADGRYFVYDAKDGDIEETWALEIGEEGKLKGAKKVADALDPQLTDDGSIVALRRHSNGTEQVITRLPGS